MTDTSAPSLAGSPFAGRPVGPRNVSHSQLAHKCQYALGFHRQRVPWPSRGISLLYGTGLHAGLEEFHLTRDLDKAIKVANRALVTEIEKPPPVRWDVKKGPNHKAAIPDLLTAQSMLARHLTAWHALRADWKGRVLSTEKTVWVNLTKMTPAWKLQCRLDATVEEDGKKGILDYKSAGKPWDEAKLEEHKSQAYLYMGAEFFDTNVAPDWFEFLVFVKGTDKIIPYRFDFSAPAINRYIEHTVRPTIAVIEAGAFVPNTNFWGHSPLYCEYWGTKENPICPLGAAAQESKEES